LSQSNLAQSQQANLVAEIRDLARQKQHLEGAILLYPDSEMSRERRRQAEQLQGRILSLQDKIPAQ
jgi:hypothetical protein